jgi:hypothetical protein
MAWIAPQDPQRSAPISNISLGISLKCLLQFELHLDVPNSGRNFYMALGAPLFLRLKFSESFSYATLIDRLAKG